MLHALIISKGYKVNNHICIGFYVRDVMKKEDLFRVFDDLRYKRNSLTYCGKRMDFDTGKKAIKDAKELINKIKEILKAP